MTSIRFGNSPEEQSEAKVIVGAMREGYLDRKAGKPLFIDGDGVPVYRVLLSGLDWGRYDLSAYAAQDGHLRSWHIGRDANNKWGGHLHDARPGSPHQVASGLRTMREARVACEQAARRTKWIEGAPW